MEEILLDTITFFCDKSQKFGWKDNVCVTEDGKIIAEEKFQFLFENNLFKNKECIYKLLTVPWKRYPEIEFVISSEDDIFQNMLASLTPNDNFNTKVVPECGPEKVTLSIHRDWETKTDNGWTGSIKIMRSSNHHINPWSGEQYPVEFIRLEDKDPIYGSIILLTHCDHDNIVILCSVNYYDRVGFNLYLYNVNSRRVSKSILFNIPSFCIADLDRHGIKLTNVDIYPKVMEPIDVNNGVYIDISRTTDSSNLKRRIVHIPAHYFKLSRTLSSNILVMLNENFLLKENSFCDIDIFITSTT